MNKNMSLTATAMLQFWHLTTLKLSLKQPLMLGENKQVLIRWISAHSGVKGNERAKTLTKKAANNTDATLLKLPIPKATWELTLKKREDETHLVHMERHTSSPRYEGMEKQVLQIDSYFYSAEAFQGK